MSNQLSPSQLYRQQEKANLEEEKLWYIQQSCTKLGLAAELMAVF